MDCKKVLIVEDSPDRRDYLTEMVQIIGYEAHAVRTKTDFLGDLREQNPDLVLLGTYNNSGQLKAFAEAVDHRKDKVPILVVRDDGYSSRQEEINPRVNLATIPSAFKPRELKLAIKKLTGHSQDAIHQELNDIIVGQSPAILQIKKHILQLSKSEVTVLITGESGTGKELVARAIHKLSARGKNPFIKVNSAAVPGNLLESELFGFEKGAFTGAWQHKPGKFKLAHSGSLLLDEIGEMPMPLQAKLLQVLQDNELSALGSTTTTKIDVRVFAVSNADLAQMVSEGRFRSDLYYRLNVVPVRLPPLRERKEDIAILTDCFLEKYARHYARKGFTLRQSTLESFYQYSWPGNIRELENIIQSIIVLGNEETIRANLQSHLQGVHLDGAGYNPIASEPSTFMPGPAKRCSLKEVCKEATRKAETDAILDALCHTRWNRRKAAKLLKISYKALLNKINEYQIEEQYRTMISKDTAISHHW